MQLLKIVYITLFNIYQQFHYNQTKNVYHYYIVYVEMEKETGITLKVSPRNNTKYLST